MKSNKVTLVFGAKGRGKSYWIKRALDKFGRHSPLLAWDPNGEYAGPGGIDSIRDAVVFTSWSEFLRAQAAQAGHLGRVVLICQPASYVPFLRYVHACGGMTVVIDELHKYVDRRQELEPLRDLLYTSRHRRINVIAAAWRPTEIPIWIRHAADEIRAFQTSEPADVQWYAQKCGEVFARSLSRLPMRRSMLWTPAGAVSALPNEPQREP